MTTKTEIRAGDYFYTSWGYDQTNIDYIVVESVSSSGKTAICRMVNPIQISEAAGQDQLMPGTAYGEPFCMRIQSREQHGLVLRGSYPYCMGSKRLDTFWLTNLGETHYQTNPMFGH